MDPLGKFQEYTGDIHIFCKGGSGAIARTRIRNIFEE